MKDLSLLEAAEQLIEAYKALKEGKINEDELLLAIYAYHKAKAGGKSK